MRECLHRSKAQARVDEEKMIWLVRIRFFPSFLSLGIGIAFVLGRNGGTLTLSLTLGIGIELGSQAYDCSDMDIVCFASFGQLQTLLLTENVGRDIAFATAVKVKLTLSMSCTQLWI